MMLRNFYWPKFLNKQDELSNQMWNTTFESFIQSKARKSRIELLARSHDLCIRHLFRAFVGILELQSEGEVLEVPGDVQREQRKVSNCFFLHKSSIENMLQDFTIFSATIYNMLSRKAVNIEHLICPKPFLTFLSCHRPSLM